MRLAIGIVALLATTADAKPASSWAGEWEYRYDDAVIAKAEVERLLSAQQIVLSGIDGAPGFVRARREIARLLHGVQVQAVDGVVVGHGGGSSFGGKREKEGVGRGWGGEGDV